MKLPRAFGLSLLGAGAACTGEPRVPESPAWADVQPILQGQCSHCHGSTAATTGFGYRLDFFDMTPAVCGEAARAIPGGSLAAASAAMIAADITPGANGDRPRMPPAPGPALEGWERETLLRWTRAPVKGPPPTGNRPPSVAVSALPNVVTDALRFTALLDDPDHDEVVGVFQIGGASYAMNRSGTFAVEIPASVLPPGAQRLSAVVCDGWSATTVDLGPVTVQR